MPPDSASPLRTASGRRPASSGVVRVAALVPMPAMLREAGIDPADLLSEFGLATDFFEDPENLIPFETAGRILSRCVQRTGHPHFGLSMGQRCGLSALGTVGYLMRSSPDVGTALQMLAGFHHIHDGGAVVSLRREDGYAILGYSILANGVECTGQILDLAIAIGANLMRELCGPGWSPVAVRLAHEAPRQVRAYRQFFGVAPGFDAESSELVFPERFLVQPLPSADPVLHRLMVERVTEASASSARDVVAALRRALRPTVGTPDCTLEMMAKRLGLAPRTLGRRLAAEGTRFRELRESVRLEAACQLLWNTSKTAGQIAETLGYSDPSAFTRAFRRKMGVAPVAWRRSQPPARD